MSGNRAAKTLIMLDLDGTIIGVDDNKSAWNALTLLSETGFRLAICTNQPPRENATDVPYWRRQLDMLTYGPIEWFICSHKRDDGCQCRKPQPGLLTDAMSMFNCEDHWMIGDKWSDVLAGHRAGVKTILVGDFGYKQKGQTVMEDTPPPTIWVPNLLSASRILSALYTT